MRLTEMGFPIDQVNAALLANGGNEEAALNSLLAGPAPVTADGSVSANGAVDSAGTSTPAVATGEAPTKPPKPSGLFGRMWGSK